jgi:hypothetical protein
MIRITDAERIQCLGTKGNQSLQPTVDNPITTHEERSSHDGTIVDRYAHAQLLRLSAGYIIVAQANTMSGITACCSSPVLR